MTQGIGLSVGATRVAAMLPDCATVTRQSVLTLYSNRPAEVGVPSENPRLHGRGLVVTGFVDRVGDPIGVMASDGSFHRGEALTATALRALTHAGNAGRGPTGIAYPAHWRPHAVEALRREVALLPEWSGQRHRPTLISDAAAALAALAAEPGLPTRGVVALCDFGGSGTSITLADAANGYRPIGPTVRHTDFSGESADRAVIAHVLADVTPADAADIAGTAAIGSLRALRAECRAAKERLSRSAVTTLPVDIPGYRGEVRLTRAELDDELRLPLASFLDVLRDHLFRNRIPLADLTAIASVGGGANIPAVTTALSDQLRVPVVTTARPELTAARGAALRAVRVPDADSRTVVAAAAAPARQPTPRALAWSEIDDVPEITPMATYSDDVAGASAARPSVDFAQAPPELAKAAVASPWYRQVLVSACVFVGMVLLGTGAVIALRGDASAMAVTVPSTSAIPPAAVPQATQAPAAPLAAAPEAAPAPPTYVVQQAPVTKIVAAPQAAPIAVPDQQAPPAAAPAPVAVDPAPADAPPAPVDAPPPPVDPPAAPPSPPALPPWLPIPSWPIPTLPPLSPPSPPAHQDPPPAHQDPPPAHQDPPPAHSGDTPAPDPQPDQKADSTK
jgi:hypothetical protein